MRATRTTRSAGRRSRPVKRLAKRLSKRLANRSTKRVVKRSVKVAAVKPVVKPAAKLNIPLEPMLYKLCKPGWAVLVDPNAERHGHTICLSILSEVASSTWSGAGI